MILHPAIVALLIASLFICLMTAYAGFWAIRILRRWDIASGSELQLSLERRTYLLSTILTYAFGFQLISLFLYIYTAERLHTLFVGAMCAAGTLNVNRYGYPVLVLKVLNFLLAGIWLILNHADTRGYDYPLIKKKYALLLGIVPLLLGEGFLQVEYFLHLKADVITSCCGSLFSIGGKAVTSDIASLPPVPMMAVFYGCSVLTLSLGLLFYRAERAGGLFAISSLVALIVSIISIISFVSLYLYELPTHHCPFCVLQREYGYAGYLFYGAMLSGGISGTGVGVLMPFRGVRSLSKALPQIRKRLVLVALVSYGILVLSVTYTVLSSNLAL